MSENLQMDPLAAALLAGMGDQKVVVKAEEIEREGGLDWAKHYFDPQPGNSYTLKFLQNLGGELITHAGIYKNLPDPKRPGKTFQYTCSGSAKTSKVLELFFDLNNEKKAGNALSSQKIEEFLGKTNQGCILVQVLESPKPEEIGIIRMLRFSTFGPNATIANLLNEKINPTEQKIKAGFLKEDVSNVFESSVMLLEVTEAVYDGVKGRDYTKSAWAPRKRGAMVRLKNAETGEFTSDFREFTAADYANNVLSAEATPYFMQLVKDLQNPDLNVHNYFAYKEVGDPKNSEETDKYLQDTQEKVDEIIPIIRNAKTIAEVKNYGKGAGGDGKESDGAQTIGGTKAADILKSGVPTELSGSILNEGASNTTNAETTGSNPAANATQTSIGDILGG